MSDEKEEYVSDGDDNSVDVPDVEDLDDDQADAIDDIDDIDDMDDEESVDNDLENKEDKPINSSINVIYSGTMSAAIEAGIQGIPSLGFFESIIL